jgi:hypothetical protein
MILYEAFTIRGAKGDLPGDLSGKLKNPCILMAGTQVRFDKVRE